MGRFILVDDNLTNIQVLESILKMLGHEFKSFSDPYKALDYVENHTPAIDMFFLDLWMPLTGDKLAAAIRNNDSYKDTPIIAVTADKQYAMSKNFDMSNFTKVLIKPIIIDRILTMLSDFGFDTGSTI